MMKDAKPILHLGPLSKILIIANLRARFELALNLSSRFGD